MGYLLIACFAVIALETAFTCEKWGRYLRSGPSIGRRRLRWTRSVTSLLRTVQVRGRRPFSYIAVARFGDEAVWFRTAIFRFPLPTIRVHVVRSGDGDLVFHLRLAFWIPLIVGVFALEWLLDGREAWESGFLGPTVIVLALLCSVVFLRSLDVAYILRRLSDNDADDQRNDGPTTV